MRAVVFLACLLALAVAQEYNIVPHITVPLERGQIRLRTKTIDVKTAEPHHAETREVATWVENTLSEAGAHLYLIHIGHPIDDAYRAGLESSLGVKLTTYLPHNTFLAALTPEAATKAQSLKGVEWVGVYRPAYKTAPEVHAMQYDGEDSVKEADFHVVWEGAGRPAPDYQAMANARFGESEVVVRVKVASPRKLAVSVRSRVAGKGVTKASVNAVAKWLSERPLVHWVEPKDKFTTTNYWARAVTQSGFDMTTPITNRNLTGQNQIIGVGDTGLDASSCFFYDPNNAVPYDTTSSTHRKIVTYITYADSNDYYAGHGTHVCGSVAGQVAYQPANITADVAPFNGQAYSAKIAFTDIGDEDGNLHLPDDLNTDYFPAPYAAGARVHSNSWGAGTPQYTSNAADADQFMWDHKDFLVLVAAGNDGSDGPYSIGTPATFKSGIAVGASLNSYESWEHYFSYDRIGINITSPTADKSYQCAVMGNWVAAPKQPIVATLIASIPSSGCTPLTNAANVAGKVVVMQMSTSCAFTTQSVNALAAGALAAIIISNDPKVNLMTGQSAPNNQIPTMMLSSADGAGINAMLAANDQPVANIAKIPLPDLSQYGNYQLNDLAPFSSWGPTADQRFKPDLVAPGYYIVSAKSNGNDSTVQCGENWVYPNAGTSMATPTLAGNMAVIRQYYTEGWYPTGAKIQANVIAAPSGALLKATALASAQYMDGYLEYFGDSGTSVTSMYGVDQGKQPSIWNGYGRVQTNTVLRFADSSFNTWMTDAATGLATGAKDVYCFTMTGGQSMTVALAWTDYPSTPTAQWNIVNNLDLLVTGPNGAVWLGNNLTEVSGGDPTIDVLNTAEVVYIKQAAPGNYKVSVRAANVPMGPQPYAIFATGNFAQATCGDTTVACPRACSAHGTCDTTTGLCACSAGWAAADCGQAIVPIPDDATAIQHSVARFSWDYYSYTVPAGGLTSLTLNAKRVSSKGDADYYITAGGRIPTLFDYDFKQTDSDTTTPEFSLMLTGQPLTEGTVYTVGVYASAPVGITTYQVSVTTVAPDMSSAASLILSPLVVALMALLAVIFA